MAQLGAIWADGIWNTAVWDTAIWSQTPVSDTTAPTLVSAVIVGGTVLKLTFDEAVTFGAGGNTGWTITMSGGAATLTYSSGDGTSALLYGISRTIADSETGTTAYTQPGNGVEDIAGNDLATIVSQAVTVLGSYSKVLPLGINIGLRL